MTGSPVKCISSMRCRVLSLSTLGSKTSVLIRNSVMAGKRGRMSEDTSKVPSWRWPEEERGEMKMTSKAKEEYRGPRIFLGFLTGGEVRGRERKRERRENTSFRASYFEAKEVPVLWLL